MLPYTRAKASTILTVISVRTKTRADAPTNMGFKVNPNVQNVIMNAPK